MSVDASVLTEPLEDPLSSATAEPKKGPGRPKGKKDSSKRAPRSDAPPKSSRFAGQRTSLQKAIADQYSTIGLVMSMSPTTASAGVAMVEQSAQAAEAWVELADQNAAVRRALEQLMTGSAWTKLAMAHVPIAIALIGPRFDGLFGGGGSAASKPGRRGPGEAKKPPPPPPPHMADVVTMPPPPTPTTQADSAPFNPAFGDVPGDVSVG